MTDKEKLLDLLGTVRTRVELISEPKYITTAARRNGATHCLNFLNEVDFNFDDAGKLIGVNTGSRRSYRGRRRGR